MMVPGVLVTVREEGIHLHRHYCGLCCLYHHLNRMNRYYFGLPELHK